MICLPESVRISQFAKKICSNRSFVSSVTFPVNHSSQLSRSDSAPPSFSFSNESRACNGASGHQSTQHLTKFLLAACCESGCCCPAGSRDFSVLETSPLNTVSERTATQRIVGGAGSRVSENEQYKQDELKRGIWAPFPDNDGSKLVRSFLRWIFRCIVKFF